MKRTEQEAIEGYFPAVVDKKMFQAIENLRQTRAPRGRYAAQSSNSVFTGLTTCGLCGSSFVRVNKGHQSYLVCTKAKDTGDCRYLAQRYEKLEDALREALPIIIREIPRGGDTKTIEETIEARRDELSELSDDIQYLVDDYAKAKSPAIRTKIDKLEEKAKTIQQEIKGLSQARENLSPSIIQKRIKQLKEATSVNPWAPNDVNKALRANIKQLRVDPTKATVDVQWINGDWAEEGFPFYTKHHEYFDVTEDVSI